MATRQRDRIVATGSHFDLAGKGSRAHRIHGPRFRFRRRTLDDQSRDRRSGARPGPFGSALPAILLTGRVRFPGQAPLGHALPIRRSPRKTGQALRTTTMDAPSSDALVFFGATGDLAYKKIFPSLQAMVKHGRLDVPVIGVAKAGWNLDQLKARARDSVEKHGGVDPAAFEKLLGLLRYVDGDYNDLSTFQALRKELGNAAHPAHYLAIPPVMFGPVVEQLKK